MSRFSVPGLFDWHAMKSYLTSLLATAVLLIAPGAVTGTAAGVSASSGPFKGKITAVDVKAHTITLTEKKTGQTKTFNARRAVITVDKQKHKHLSDVKVGMHAKVKMGKKGHFMISAKTHAGKKKKTAN
jgi:hypothetical protein